MKPSRKEYHREYLKNNRAKINKYHRDYYYRIKNGDQEIYRAFLKKKKGYQKAYRDRLKAKAAAAKLEQEIG